MTDAAKLTTGLRSDVCGALRPSDVGRRVRLAGWIHRRRDHGSLVFIDLRDRYGIVQVVVDAAVAPEAHAALTDARSEWVIAVEGTVAARRIGTENEKLATGGIEVAGESVTVLSQAKTPPFYINDTDAPVDESLRLKYRYLDLRREPLRDRILLRSAMVQAIREVHHEHGFVEVETPILIKSTPEGARDFIVPSRLQQGSVYALPQSPQQMKQLLMVAGFDRYFQIARCFRDEDLRGDRQPEFTQLDIEMTFVEQEDLMGLIEQLYIDLTETFSAKRIQQKPFPRITYAESMRRFGNDRPDMRFGVELQDVSAAFAGTQFNAFAQTLASGGQIKAIVVPGCAEYTRREIDELTEMAKRSGAKGLATFSVKADETRSPIAKFLTPEEMAAITAGIGAVPGDLVLAVADAPNVVAKTLSALRDEIGRRLNLADPNVFAFCWVYEFPLLEYNEDEGRWEATHNPFSGFLAEDAHLIATDPSKVRAKQYDLVGNGFELGGGSVRNHRRSDQEAMFALMGYPKEDLEARFGALLEALDYGAPPHGGIAMGVDRFAMLLAEADNIREVIAFPKNQRGHDVMFGAPDQVVTQQLEDLGLVLDQKKAVDLW